MAILSTATVTQCPSKLKLFMEESYHTRLGNKRHRTPLIRHVHN